MDMAAAFLSLFACSVYADDRGGFDMFSSKIEAMAVLREATIERMALLRW